MAAEQFSSYSLDNDGKFRRALKDAYEQVGNLRIPFTLIAKDFYRSEKAIFQLSGPGLYDPISPKYAKAKERQWGFIYPLLKAAGNLERSLTDPTDGFAVNFIDSSGSSLVLGTLRAYGLFHQSDQPRKKIPLRKFLFIGPEAPRFANSDQIGRLERWLNIINGYVLKKLDQLGETKGG